MAVVGEVPGLQLEVSAFQLARRGLDLCHLLARRLHIGIEELVEEVIDIICRLSHPLLQHIVGEGLVAQQLCVLAAQVYELLYNRLIAEFASANAERVLGHIHLAAQLAIVGVGHEGTVGRGVEGEEPTFFAVLFGSESGSIAGGVGQAGEVGLVGDMELVGVGGFQVVL